MSTITQWCADYFAPLHTCQAESVQPIPQEEETSCCNATAWKVASYFLIVIPFILALVWGFSALADWLSEAIEEATDPLAQRVPVHYIGVREWTSRLDVDQLGLSFGEFSRLRSEEIHELRSSLNLFTDGREKIRDNMGVTVLEIPKGVTPNMLIQSLNEMGIQLEGFKRQTVIDQFGDVKTPESYRVVITNSDITLCNLLSVRNQREVLEKEVFNNNEWKTPKLVEMLALLFFRERMSLGPTYQNANLPGCTDVSKFSMMVSCEEHVVEGQVPVLFRYHPSAKEVHVFITSSESNCFSSGAAKRI